MGFVVLKDGVTIDNNTLEKELIELIRAKIGPVASFKKSMIVMRLPKTRSGKILRKSIRQLAKQKSIPIPATIDDPKILDEIRAALEDQGLAG